MKNRSFILPSPFLPRRRVCAPGQVSETPYAGKRVDCSQTLCFRRFLSTVLKPYASLASSRAPDKPEPIKMLLLLFSSPFLSFLLSLFCWNSLRAPGGGFPGPLWYLFAAGTPGTPTDPRRISELAKGPGILFVAPPLRGRLAQPPEDV